MFLDTPSFQVYKARMQIIIQILQSLTTNLTINFFIFKYHVHFYRWICN
jgi:succinate dehydrogenase/fumarate reductase cytochrome b subunit